MIKLTVAIITYNEENNIGRCISSVLPIADEILIVDSFSTDKTEEIATALGARFVKNPFKGHIEQKNFALNLANNDYILSLDADEALSPELLEEIKSVKNNCINTQTYNSKSQYTTKYICTSLDKEHVLEELAMCGFDVEYVEKPVLNEHQRLELWYLISVKKHETIAKDGDGAIYAFKNKPSKKLEIWQASGSCTKLELEYDFVSWKDKEPYSITDLFLNENE